MEVKTIKLTNLCVNTNNPRFESQTSQKEAMERIVEDQKGKLVALAADILEHGLNPMDMILVSPLDGVRFIVLEGNRRVTALKIMANPMLIEDSFSSIRKRFVKLVEGKDISKLKNIQCLIEEDDVQANLWIKRKHAGELGGVGTVSWTSLQIQRFDANNDGKTSDTLQIIGFLSKSSDTTDDFKGRLNSLNTTNLSRLIADPDVRRTLGIDKESGSLYSSVSKETVVRNLTTLIEGIMSPGFTVKQIYNKEKRKEYVNSLGLQTVDGGENVEAWSLNDSSDTLASNYRKTTAKKASPTRNNLRASLIPSKFDLPIENPRILQIFEELKRTSMRQSPNAVAVLFRVFLELSVDSFIDEHTLFAKGTTSASDEKNLIGKSSRVIEYLRKNDLLSKNELKGIQHELKDETSIFSIDSLNAFVHNMYFSPKEDSLRIGWDNVQPFFEVVWNNIMTDTE